MCVCLRLRVLPPCTFNCKVTHMPKVTANPLEHLAKKIEINGGLVTWHGTMIPVHATSRDKAEPTRAASPIYRREGRSWTIHRVLHFNLYDDRSHFKIERYEREVEIAMADTASMVEKRKAFNSRTKGVPRMLPHPKLGWRTASNIIGDAKIRRPMIMCMHEREIKLLLPNGRYTTSRKSPTWSLTAQTMGAGQGVAFPAVFKRAEELKSPVASRPTMRYRVRSISYQGIPDAEAYEAQGKYASSAIKPVKHDEWFDAVPFVHPEIVGRDRFKMVMMYLEGATEDQVYEWHFKLKNKARVSDDYAEHAERIHKSLYGDATGVRL